MPDTDRWETWSRPIRELVDEVDLAFLDGTFAAASEVKGRSLAEYPHPLMSVTRERLRGARGRVWFIHLNHTNQERLDGAGRRARGDEVPALDF